MRRNLQVTIALALTAVFAISAVAQIPPRDEPTNVKESECYSCHSDSTNGPPIQVMYLVHGFETSIPIGEKGVLEVGVENGWTSELREITAIADLGGVDSLQFASELDPITEVLRGEFETSPTIGAQRDGHTFNVVPATTDFTVTLESDTSRRNTAPADYELHITPPDGDLIIVDDSGLGEPETYEVHGLQAIEELGTGTWTIDVVLPPPAENPTTPLNHPYILTMDAQFRGTGVPIQFISTETVLASAAEKPGQLAYLEWTLFAESMPSGPTTLPVEVILIAFYDHAPNHSQYDEWRYTKTIELQVTPDEANDAIIVSSTGVTEDILDSSSFSWGILSEVVGYISAVLILASIYTGGMFGKASRRQLNTVFGTAKRRVAFHNFLSYAILAAAAAHTIIFLAEPAFDWTLGIIWGSIAILAMIALGVTGALQVPMIRKWNYATWRWSHFYLSIGTITFTIIHILLDGVHFADLQEAVGWSNPFNQE